jgi:hypothetical protein
LLYGSNEPVQVVLASVRIVLIVSSWFMILISKVALKWQKDFTIS